MGSLDGTIIYKTSEYRPCLVNGKEALFHRWVDISRLVDASPMIGGHPGGTVSYCVGLVECEDGQILEVSPGSIKFTDGLFIAEHVHEYCEWYKEYMEKKEKEKEND